MDPTTSLEQKRAGKPISKPRQTAAGFFYVIAATILWSISPVCIKFALRSVDAFSLGWIRFAVGAAILFAIGRARGNTMKIKKHDIWLAVMAAVGLGLNHTIYIKGVQHTTASASGVIVQLEVISLVILSYFILKDRIGWLKGFGILVTFGGVFLTAWNGAESLQALLDSKYLYGNILVTISAPLWAIYAIGQKLLSDRGVAVSSSIFYIFAFAAIVTMPTALAFHNIHGPLDLVFWIALTVFVVFATVGACGLMAKGFDLLDASTAGVITSVFPMLTIINSWMFLGEVPTLIMWLGGGLVVLGVLVIGITEAKNSPCPIERQ